MFPRFHPSPLSGGQDDRIPFLHDRMSPLFLLINFILTISQSLFDFNKCGYAASFQSGEQKKGARDPDPFAICMHPSAVGRHTAGKPLLASRFGAMVDFFIESPGPAP